MIIKINFFVFGFFNFDCNNFFYEKYFIIYDIQLSFSVEY